MDELTPPTIFAEVRYHDARRAIELLTDAFGFEERLVVLADDGAIVHAELTFGNGLVMVGSVDDEDRIGGSCLCIVVDDPDAHQLRAAAAGADIVQPVHETDYGARAYVAHDHESNVWVFSDYQPFAVGN